MRFQGIVFDKDGTLFDFNATWGAWTRQLVQNMTDGDPALAQAMAEAIGFDLITGRFAKTSPVIAGTADEIVEAFLPFRPGMDRDEVIDEMHRLAATAPQVQAAPLAPLLDQLIAMGMTLGVATNDAEMPARAHLDANGVTDRFAFIAGYDSGFGGKPEAGQLLAFCAQTGLQPEACLMVGDSTHDLIAGQVAGMTRVAVLTGIADAEDLADHADVILTSIAELPALLSGIADQRS